MTGQARKPPADLRRQPVLIVDGRAERRYAGAFETVGLVTYGIGALLRAAASGG